MKKDRDLKDLDQLIETEYGKRGIPQREKFEKGYQKLKLGWLVQKNSRFVNFKKK